MLKKRIIPCLDIKNGRTVKGVNFLSLKDAGDPVILAKQYALDGADELVFLDISATIEERKPLAKLVAEIAKEINIPFTVGGGIKTIEDVHTLIRAGADKVSINSSAVSNPKLIEQISNEFGSQCLVVAIDVKQVNKCWNVYIKGGRVATGIDAIDWASKAERLGAGEILLTSMNNDGVQHGFDIDITRKICDAVNIPVIASGGAGNKMHFKELFEQSNASAALAASIFHFGDIRIQELKNYLAAQNLCIR